MHLAATAAPGRDPGALRTARGRRIANACRIAKQLPRIVRSCRVNAQRGPMSGAPHAYCLLLAANYLLLDQPTTRSASPLFSVVPFWTAGAFALRAPEMTLMSMTGCVSLNTTPKPSAFRRMSAPAGNGASPFSHFSSARAVSKNSLPCSSVNCSSTYRSFCSSSGPWPTTAVVALAATLKLPSFLATTSPKTSMLMPRL